MELRILVLFFLFTVILCIFTALEALIVYEAALGSLFFMLSISVIGCFIFPCCWVVASKGWFVRHNVIYILYLVQVFFFFVFVIPVQITASLYGNAPFPKTVRVTDIALHKGYTYLKFPDAEILTNYTTCADIQYGDDTRFGAVAPLVPSNFTTEFDAIPAFVLTWNVNQPCTVDSSALWDLPLNEGSRLEYYYKVSELLNTTFYYLNITNTSMDNVIIWRDLDTEVHRAELNFLITILVAFGCLATVLFVTCVYIFGKWIKLYIFSTKGTHVRYETVA